MLRRKPTRIDLRAEDREELDEVHRLRFASVTTPSSSSVTSKPSDSANPNPNPLYKLLDPSLDPVTKSQRIALASSSDIMKKVVGEFGLGDEKGKPVVCLGGFKNVRAVYDWKEGLVLELDETSFNFGTVYEVECETTDPERTKELLEDFLKEIKVPYVYSQSNKFAIFQAGKLLS